jgi:hypothetical protein
VSGCTTTVWRRQLEHARNRRASHGVRLYDGSDDWVEDLISEAKKCLLRKTPPPAAEGCDYCDFAACRA